MKAQIDAMIDVPVKPEELYGGIVDSRTCREVSAKTVSDLTELALQRKNQREVSR